MSGVILFGNAERSACLFSGRQYEGVTRGRVSVCGRLNVTACVCVCVNHRPLLLVVLLPELEPLEPRSSYTLISI